MSLHLAYLRETGSVRNCISNRSFLDMVNDPNSIKSDPNEVVVTLESLDTGCLLHIVQYLNAMDIVNLTKTCRRFEELSASILPHKSEQICISRYCRLQSQQTDAAHTLGAEFLAPLDRTNASTVKLQCLASGFTYFGELVRNLSFEMLGPNDDTPRIWRSCMTMLQRCENLTSLRLNGKAFQREDTYNLQSIVEHSRHLTELDLGTCSGLTNQWPLKLNGISTVRKLSLCATNDLSDNFVQYFSALRSLSVNFDLNLSSWHFYDFIRLFDVNAGTITHLKLSINKYANVRDFLMQKLPKLDCLELSFVMTENSERLISLPHLRTLNVDCLDKNVNTVLRTLSITGAIEELTFSNGIFVAERQLNLSKLRTFRWIHPGRMPRFWYAMKKTQMPTLQTFIVEFNSKIDLPTNDLLDFIASKKSLKLLRLVNFNYQEQVIMSQFFLELIALLEEPCTPKRPVLNLEIGLLRLQEPEVRFSEKHIRQ